MDSGDRELFARSVRAALESGADLSEVGWEDALADDQRAAVGIVFDTQGRLCATSSALDQLDERVGRLALSHELIGAARTMLDQARQHALEREQFGQPIAQFQAVRHRLAEALVAVEGAEAMLEAAWDDGGADTAAMAKAVAGRNAKTAARHCQQVLAGIGFTTEHPFHLYLKRVLLLDQLLGSSARLTRQLGEQLLRTRQLPAPISL
jgi:acyl-CoA dehydrogenase-like protein